MSKSKPKKESKVKDKKIKKTKNNYLSNLGRDKCIEVLQAIPDLKLGMTEAQVLKVIRVLNLEKIVPLLKVDPILVNTLSEEQQILVVGWNPDYFTNIVEPSNTVVLTYASAYRSFISCSVVDAWDKGVRDWEEDDLEDVQKGVKSYLSHLRGYIFGVDLGLKEKLLDILFRLEDEE